MDPAKVSIEERLMFLERDIEQLRDQLTEVWRSVERIERLVERLQKLLEESQSRD